MLRYLVLDRSTCRPSLSVFDDQTPVLEHVWMGEPTRAPDWMNDLAGLLRANGIGADTVGGFVCGLGPGSFSGIRASLAALSGLALAGGRPVYGIASSAALAFGWADAASGVTVVGDARRNRLWHVTYRFDAGPRSVRLFDGRQPSQTAADYQLVPAEGLSASIPPKTRVVTSDWERLQTVLRSSVEERRLVQEAVYPTATALGRLALSEAASAVLEPVPIYLHPAVAEPHGPADSRP